MTIVGVGEDGPAGLSAASGDALAGAEVVPVAAAVWGTCNGSAGVACCTPGQERQGAGRGKGDPQEGQCGWGDDQKLLLPPANPIEIWVRGWAGDGMGLGDLRGFGRSAQKQDARHG